jgi:N-acetylglucosaminyldiphosphoundecaprenol N-acetyl-beta-D-mannosaminyltransferase
MIRKYNLFGVWFDTLSILSLRSRVNEWFDARQFFQIATINPEFLLEARKSETFRALLHACEYKTIDGMGVQMGLLWRYHRWVKHRVTGVDMMQVLLETAEAQQKKVFCVVRKDGLSTWISLRRILKHHYPTLHIDGVAMSATQTAKSMNAIITKRMFEADVVLCNFGMPYQEYFLASLRGHKRAKMIAMGVGGSFDFLTQRLSRAPRQMRVFGLEWLWRLWQQPSRWKRIVRATFLFPLLVVWES